MPAPAQIFEDAVSPLPRDMAERTAVESQLLDLVALVHETCPNGRLTRVNATMCAKSGYSEAELLGQSHRIIHPGLSPFSSWLDLHTYSAETGVWSGETLNLSHDHADLWLSTTASAIRDSVGTITGYCFVSIDITEKKKLHEEFQRSAKLMQLGQLTATVAHEIRNPLGAIRTANFVLEKKLKGQVEGVEPQLERINVSIRRCDKIITELLDFTRKKVVKASEHAVDAWVRETVEEVGNTLAGGAQVAMSLNLGDQTAKFDPEQMRQVVINLLNNAAEAMSEMVKNGTAPEEYAPRIKLTTRLSGPHVQIVVQDNGPGIEPKNLKKIREPLFTTKSFGVGLGISAIEKILQDHKGGLDIQSTFGEGATMTASILQAGPDLQPV